MKKYKFKLQAVLREREIREDERKRDMAKALDKLRIEQELLLKFKDLRESNLNAISNEKIKDFPDIRQLRLYEVYVIFLNNRIANQKNAVKSAEAKLMEARLKLFEATKRRKIMSILKENKRVEYYMEIDKAEQKEIDEFSVMRSGKTWLT
jgi:flagellar protein FliJ